MTDFYANRLGLPITYEGAGQYCFLALGTGGPQLALFAREESESKPAGDWFFALDVDGLDTLVAELRNAGVAMSDIFDVAGGRAAKITDPEGNVLEIHEPSVARDGG